jgi:hypothetical protein
MLHQSAAIVYVNVETVSNCLWKCYIIFLQSGSNCLWLMLHHLAIVCENVTSFFYKVGVIVYVNVKSVSNSLSENVTSVSNCLWKCYIIFLQSGSNCLWECYIIFSASGSNCLC